ncbi:MAG: hypothetical protein IJ746_02925 [Ruminococcus sp.]|nr:hypothetical protein [Ruminococcus sp.]
MGIVTDMTQDQKIAVLERKVKLLERKTYGGNAEMKLLKELVGTECVINGNGLYETKCRIDDVDEEWVKITEHSKKAETVKFIRIDDIQNITVAKEQ